MANIKYFYRDQELTRINTMPNAEFATNFPGVRGFAVDSFKKQIGYTADHRGPYAVERKITYKSFPSRHECNSKCMNGHVNGACECSCGGKNHGIGAILNGLSSTAK